MSHTFLIFLRGLVGASKIEKFRDSVGTVTGRRGASGYRCRCYRITLPISGRPSKQTTQRDLREVAAMPVRCPFSMSITKVFLSSLSHFGFVEKVLQLAFGDH